MAEAATDASGSGEDLFHHARPLQTSEAFFQTVALEMEILMVETEGVEDGGVEVVDADGVDDGFVAEVVRLPVGKAGFDAATGHP